MKYLRRCLVGLLIFALLAPPVLARPRGFRGGRRGSSSAGIALGVIAAAAAAGAFSDRHHHRHDHGRYGQYPTYGASYYGSTVYDAPVYGAPMYRFRPPGAASFVDASGFRNYHDVYGNFIGRVPLYLIRPGSW